MKDHTKFIDTYPPNEIETVPNHIKILLLERLKSVWGNDDEAIKDNYPYEEEYYLKYINFKRKAIPFKVMNRIRLELDDKYSSVSYRHPGEYRARLWDLEHEDSGIKGYRKFSNFTTTSVPLDQLNWLKSHIEKTFTDVQFNYILKLEILIKEIFNNDCFNSKISNSPFYNGDKGHGVIRIIYNPKLHWYQFKWIVKPDDNSGELVNYYNQYKIFNFVILKDYYSFKMKTESNDFNINEIRQFILDAPIDMKIKIRCLIILPYFLIASKKYSEAYDMYKNCEENDVFDNYYSPLAYKYNVKIPNESPSIDQIHNILGFYFGLFLYLDKNISPVIAKYLIRGYNIHNYKRFPVVIPLKSISNYKSKVYNRICDKMNENKSEIKMIFYEFIGDLDVKYGDKWKSIKKVFNRYFISELHKKKWSEVSESELNENGIDFKNENIKYWTTERSEGCGFLSTTHFSHSIDNDYTNPNILSQYLYRRLEKDLVSQPFPYNFELGFAETDETVNYLHSMLRNAENEIRTEHNLPKVGEGWVSETALFNKIKQKFPQFTVLHDYGPFWLKPQRLDVYIEELNIGFEYQGEQHQNPVKIFGGDEGHKNIVRLDAKKKELCENNNCQLIYIYPENNDIEVDIIINGIMKEN